MKDDLRLGRGTHDPVHCRQDTKRAHHRGGDILARRGGRPRPPGRVRLHPRSPCSSATCTAITRSTGVSRRRSGTSSTTRGGSTTTPSSPASRATPRAAIETDDDVRDVIAMIRLSYDRAVAKARAAGRRRWGVGGSPRAVRVGAGAAPVRAVSARSARSCCSAPAGTSSSTARHRLESEAHTIRGLGGISRHYLNHRHEAAFASDWVDAPLFVHEAECEVGHAQLPGAGDLLAAPRPRRGFRGDPNARPHPGSHGLPLGQR